MKRLYLDYAATTPPRPEVVKMMAECLANDFGNPSSIYSYGKEAKQIIEDARAKVAAILGASEEEVVFTGGGSEADNLAIKGVALANRARGNHIITTAIEHHAVGETCEFLEEQGFEVTYLPVDQHGLVSPDDVKKAITSKTVLISIMHANNEIGTIEPIGEIGRVAAEAGVYFHTDAVQTVGHIPTIVDDLKVDLLSTSAHKLYGPKGVGVLYVRKGTRLTPLIHGGEQEKGRRASTENVPGIAGFGVAAELARLEMDEEAERITALRDRLVEQLLARIDGVHLNGHPTLRLPNNVNISIANVEGETVVTSLDREGICISTRSACNSAAVESSHVLRAIGLLPEEAYGSVRLTLGKWTTAADIDKVLETLPEIVARLRADSPLARRLA